MSRTFKWLMSIIVAFVIGVLANHFYDRFYSKADLTLVKVSEATIIESKEQIEKLRITYDAEPLQKLTKTSFMVKNTGGTPIRRDDVEKGVFYINFNVKLLDFKMLNDGLEYQISNVGHELTEDRTVAQLEFPLLNEQEFFSFDIMTEEPIDQPNIEAKIAGISKINFQTGEDGELNVSAQSTPSPESYSSIILYSITGASFLAVVFSVIVGWIFLSRKQAEYNNLLQIALDREKQLLSRIKKS